MSKTYTILVIRDSEQPVILYQQEMGELPAVTIDTLTGQRRRIGLTPSHYAHMLLIASTEPGLYHRVKWNADRRCVVCATCRSGECEHAQKHPLYVAS